MLQPVSNCSASIILFTLRYVVVDNVTFSPRQACGLHPFGAQHVVHGVFTEDAAIQDLAHVGAPISLQAVPMSPQPSRLIKRFAAVTPA